MASNSLSKSPSISSSRIVGSSIAPCDKIDIKITDVEWVDSYANVCQQNKKIQDWIAWKGSKSTTTTQVNPDEFFYQDCSDKPAVYFINKSNATGHKTIKLKVVLKTICGSKLPISVSGSEAKLIISFNNKEFTSKDFNLPLKDSETTVTFEFSIDQICWLKSPIFSLEYNDNGTPIRKNNIFSEKIPLEAFVLYEEPASFYQSGVWSEALRFLFEKTNINNDSQKEKSLEKITQYLHSQHGVRYDIHSGGTYFTVLVNKFGFSLMRYLKKKTDFEIKNTNSSFPDIYGRTDIRRVKTQPQPPLLQPPFMDFNIVNCYDQAAAINTLSGALGIKTEFLFINPFGYIKETKLVGIDDSFDFIPTSPPDECNNPFFANPGAPPLRIVNGFIDTIFSYLPRSSFDNHAVCAFLSNNKTYSDYTNDLNQYEKDVLIYDACAGPILGLDFDQYTKKAVDYDMLHPISIKIEITYNIDKVLWDDIH